MPRALAVSPDRRKFRRIDKSREREPGARCLYVCTAWNRESHTRACVCVCACVRAMPQLASYLRAIGCRAAISSDRITARLANGPGLPAVRAVLFLSALFSSIFPIPPLVSVTTITLIIALRLTVASAERRSAARGIFNFRLKNASVINRSDI